MKQELIIKFEDLIKQEFNKEVLSELKQLRQEIEALIEADTQKQKETFLADEENEVANFSPSQDEDTLKYYELSKHFSEKRKAYALQMAELEKANLDKKLALIDKISKITEEEEVISKAYNQFKECKEAFQALGRVPGDKHKEIQTAYFHAVDSFYYNIKIYKDIKDHDLKRNLEIKTELLTKLKGVDITQPLKDIDKTIKNIQTEWFDVGPVPQEAYEALKTEFNALCDKVYELMRDAKKVKLEEQQVNLEKKKALLEQAKSVDITDLNNHKNWKKATEKLLALQEEWKTIGYGPKKENEEIWQAFRAVADTFFTTKQTFYDRLKKDQTINKTEKEKMVETVQALKDSTDWDGTTQRLKKLQTQWKNIGPAGQKDEQRLWTEFREACNYFFEQKSGAFASQKEEQVENLKLKEALLVELEALALTDDKDNNLKLIKDFNQKWNAVGYIPKEAINDIRTKYDTLLNQKFEASGINKEELEHGRFVSKIQNILAQENADFLFQKELRFITDNISQAQQEVLQLENNLAFFNASKGNALMKDALKRVDIAKAKHKSLEAQKRLMQKMKREADKPAEETVEVNVEQESAE